MKNLKALNSLALAGVAVLVTGCSSMNSADNNETSPYRTASAGGWVPITQASEMNKFPIEWNMVSFEQYRFAVPSDDAVGASASAEVGSDASASVALNADADADADAEAGFSADLEPGSTFVEAAGADGEVRVRKVILHTPFQR